MNANSNAGAAAIIVPTNGRIVWFITKQLQLDNDAGADSQPIAAMISHCNNERNIDLTVFARNGSTYGANNVRLLQAGDPHPEPGTEDFAMWMPYQQGQAARTQQVESAKLVPSIDEIKAAILQDPDLVAAIAATKAHADAIAELQVARTPPTGDPAVGGQA